MRLPFNLRVASLQYIVVSVLYLSLFANIPTPLSATKLSATQDNAVEPGGVGGDAGSSMFSRYNVPTLIDWNSYKQMFKKNYSSPFQQWVRQSIFIPKSMQVMITAFKYKMYQSDYYTSINEFSDLTRDEEVRLLSGDPDGSGDPSSGFLDDEEVERLLLSEELEGDVHHESEESSREIANRRSLLKRSQQTNGVRRKRSILSAAATTLARTLSATDLVQKPSSDEDCDQSEAEALKIKRVIPSNNPDYKPIELPPMSGVALAKPPSGDIPSDRIEAIERETKEIWKKFGFMRHAIGGALSWLVTTTGEPESEPIAKQPKKGQQKLMGCKRRDITNGKQPEDQMIRDWRKSGCISPAMNQGACNSCYAVASMAFVEWALCMSQDKVLTPLSVQYMVSCGHQFSQERNMEVEFYGCNRGESKQTMKFVEEYGVDLESNMPYLGVDAMCPIGLMTPRKQKGYLRPNVKGLIRMVPKTKQLDLALKKGPLIGRFTRMVDFMGYRGGILDKCHPDGGHSMLIVGNGFDNGVEFLLVKNSFGPDWGLSGYFKLRRSALADCVKQLLRPRLSFPGKKAQTRRIKAYLADRHNMGSSEENNFDNDEHFTLGTAGGMDGLFMHTE